MLSEKETWEDLLSFQQHSGVKSLDTFMDIIEVQHV